MITDDNASFDTRHWEALIETIVDRIGVESFLATAACVLRRKRAAARPDDPSNTADEKHNG